MAEAHTIYKANREGCLEKKYYLHASPRANGIKPFKHECYMAKTYCSPDYYFFMSPATHNCFMFFRKGKGTLIYDGVTYHPKAGDFFLLHKGHSWEFYTDKEDLWETIWINTHMATVEAAISDFCLDNVVAIPPSGWEKHMEALYQIIAHSKETIYEKREKVARMLFSILSDIYHLVTLPKGKSKQETDAITMKSYIDEHACSPLSIPEISRLVMRSESGATTIFKSFFGVSLKQYILQAKFRLAETYLIQGELSIDEIANVLSFCNTQHFSQSFRKNRGCSPSQFQKMHKRK